MRRLIVLLALYSLVTACCNINDESGEGSVYVDFHINDQTRSDDPQENLINDINLFVFNEMGGLEEHRYHKYSEGINLRLLLHKRYSIYACANLGWKLNISTEEELNRYRYWFAYPDDYRTGIPLCGKIIGFELEDFSPVTVGLERAMAKVSVRIDRRKLDSDVLIKVRSIKVGGCPRSVLLFGESHADGSSDVFASGFTKSSDAVSTLNYGTVGRISESVSVFILENLQGNLLENDISEKEKHFGEYDPRAKLCSFIEVKTDYSSPSENGTVTYRFYLGEGNGNFDVRRNHHYNITLAFEGDGLSDEGWRVVKDGLITNVRTISINRKTLSFSYKGECIRLEATMSPTYAQSSKLLWQSSDSGVAQVSSDGEVTATGEGTCSITCFADDGGNSSAVCEVISNFADPYARFYTENYIECEVGDTVHLGCDYFPPNTVCDIGIDDMDFDKERGIYDYIIDEDGRGAKLIFRKKGTGLVQYALGTPLEIAENFIMICEP